LSFISGKTTIVFPEMKDKELEISLGEKQVGEIAAVIK
jgi:PTS system glucose-specific IIA component